MKILNIQTKTYDIGQGFRVDVVKRGNKIEIWYYHKNYGIKELEYGFEHSFGDEKEIEELIKINQEKFKYYYREEYMEE